jgi:hypothetical protein
MGDTWFTWSQMPRGGINNAALVCALSESLVDSRVPWSRTFMAGNPWVIYVSLFPLLVWIRICILGAYLPSHRSFFR